MRIGCIGGQLRDRHRRVHSPTCKLGIDSLTLMQTRDLPSSESHESKRQYNSDNYERTCPDFHASM